MGSVQSLSRHLDQFSPNVFEYLVIDERTTPQPNRIKSFSVTFARPLRSA